MPAQSDLSAARSADLSANISAGQNVDNSDAAELRKFAALAAGWWDPLGPMRPLHELNPLRLQWIDRIASLRGKRVLDVGCGGGLLTEAMCAAGAQVTGIDLAEASLQVAARHAAEKGMQLVYRNVAAEALAEEAPSSYDVVTCMEMLEHVPQPEQIVQACRHLARPGGWIFFSTINRNAKAFLLAIVGAEYLLNLLPRGTHEYAKLIRPSELAQFARAAGLELVEMAGITYNPLSRRFALSSNTDVNYMMATRLPA